MEATTLNFLWNSKKIFPPPHGCCWTSVKNLSLLQSWVCLFLELFSAISCPFLPWYWMGENTKKILLMEEKLKPILHPGLRLVPWLRTVMQCGREVEHLWKQTITLYRKPHHTTNTNPKKWLAYVTVCVDVLY